MRRLLEILRACISPSDLLAISYICYNILFSAGLELP